MEVRWGRRVTSESKSGRRGVSWCERDGRASEQAGSTAGVRGSMWTSFPPPFFFLDFFPWVPRFASDGDGNEPGEASLRLCQLRSREKSHPRQEFRVGSDQRLRLRPDLFRGIHEISDDFASTHTSALSPFPGPLMIRHPSWRMVNCSRRK
jgi:hypothetical protein